MLSKPEKIKGMPYSGASPDFEAFNNLLALLESGGLYGLKNAQGFVGRYQLGQDRLGDYNRIHRTQHSLEEFLNSPDLQETVQVWHVQDIDAYIEKTGLNRHLGQNYRGLTWTRNSFRAVAHLGGKLGLRKFVLSNGLYDPADANGTRLSDYALHFATVNSVKKARELGTGIRVVSSAAAPIARAELDEKFLPKEGEDWARRDDTLGRHLPIGEAEGLKFRVDGQTSPQSLLDIIDWLNVDNSPRYAADEVDTFCNIYASDYCYLAGAFLPRIWWNFDDLPEPASGAGQGQQVIELTVNGLFEWLVDFGERFGWHRASNLTELQAAANRGSCALILAKSPPERHGHVAVVCPEAETRRAERFGDLVQVPLQSQTPLRAGQQTTNPEWWREAQFIEHGYWYNDRQHDRPERLKPNRWIASVTQYFFPRECEFLDAKLSIYRGEISRSPRLPNEFIPALVAGEDKRFFRHPGFDAIAILRAIYRFCRKRKIEGASTIEQQLVRTITGKRERTLRRKLGEILLAMRYASALDKETIATIYLENAYFGWRATGYRNALKRPEFIRKSELETAAWMVASLRYPVASSESEKRRNVRARRAKFIIDRIENGKAARTVTK